MQIKIEGEVVKANDPAIVTDLPEAPGQPQVDEITAENASITWAPPDHDGGAPITNYVVEYRKVGDTKWSHSNPDTVVPETAFTVSALQPEVDYEFRVAAQNKAGVGPYSPPSEPRQYG